MPIHGFVKYYLDNYNEGLKAILTVFLNHVSLYKAEQYAGEVRYQGQNAGRL